MMLTSDADIERFLLDDVGDGERQQKNPALRPTDGERRPISFDIDHRVFRNEGSFPHDAESLAE